MLTFASKCGKIYKDRNTSEGNTSEGNTSEDNTSEGIKG